MHVTPPGEAEAASSQWLGALIFYAIHRGKIPLDKLWTKKYAIRNLWVGYVVKLVLLATILIIIWELFLKELVLL